MKRARFAFINGEICLDGVSSPLSHIAAMDYLATILVGAGILATDEPIPLPADEETLARRARELLVARLTSNSRS